jgi:ribose transport system substrate-binding protein
MHTTPRRTKRATTVALLLAGATALTLSACSTGAAAGSTAAAGGSVPPAVTENLATYQGEVDLSYAGPKFNAAPAKGKRVWWITHSADNPFLATLGDNFKEALTKAGVTVTSCDGKGNPVDENNCISQAVAQKADLIQIDGAGTPETYANSLAQANAAGIPVLAGASVDASNPLYKGLAGQSSQGFDLSGQLMADWIVKDSGANANVLFLTVPDVDGSVEEQKAFSDELTKTCPNCKVTVTGVTLPNWASDLGTTVNAALLKDPNITYVVPVFDPMTQFTNPAIQQAGKSGTVKVVTGNGSLQPMKDLQTGGGVNAANVGTDMYALGYIEADLALRALSGQPTVENAIAPTRVFDQSNIGALTINGDAFTTGAWYSDPAKTSAFFQSLWGL